MYTDYERVTITVGDKTFLVKGPKKYEEFIPSVSEYKIETFKDMIECVDENSIDNFLKCLEMVLRENIEAKKKFGSEAGVKSFTWINDGLLKKDLHYVFEGSNENEIAEAQKECLRLGYKIIQSQNENSGYDTIELKDVPDEAWK